MQKTVEGVTFEVLPDRITATIEKGRGFAFQGVDLETLTSQFATFFRQARAHFGPRRPPALDEGFLDEILAEATLNALWLARGKAVPADWLDLPSTQRIVHWAVSKKWRRNKDKVAAVTAQLFGFTPEQYARWREGEERFQNR